VSSAANSTAFSRLAGARVLIVDDEDYIREFFESALESLGIEVGTACDGQAACEVLRDQPFDVVITDLKMPRMDGMTLLRHCSGCHPTTPVIILTAYGTIENAVEAMRGGAFDYLAKPITETEQIEIVLSRALRHRSALVENMELRRDMGERYMFDRLVGPGPKMQRIFDILTTVAPTQATVLITGSSGTGKELVARAIHFNSPRAKGPFIKVNCAALPEGLIESELFGHEKGAFTGALKTTKGRFEAADNGTLLLDEISEMPQGLQAKLLRALQEREFERVGSTQSVKVDVRVIATSNIDIEKAAEEKRFRQDLYYRLNVIPIRLPTLAERREDIPVLAYHFLRRFAKMHGKCVERISTAGMSYLNNAPWPGNVRELENAIERAVVLCRGEQIELGDFFISNDVPPQPALSLPASTLPAGYGSPLEPIKLAELEKQHILATLKTMKGQRQNTADALGISIRTLRNKLNEYRIEGVEI